MLFRSELSKKITDAHLTLVGDGELRTDVEEYVIEKGLKEKVTFTGNRNDIPSILSAMDYFLLPSRGEGFGIVFIEAQAMGLYCFASDTVPKSVNMGNISFIPLECTPYQWASQIEEIYFNHETREIRPEHLEHFNIKSTESKIARIYNREAGV